MIRCSGACSRAQRAETVTQTATVKATATPTPTTVANAATNASTTANQPALDAFLNAFTTALAQKDAAPAPSFVAEQTKDDSTPLPDVAGATSTNSSPTLPFAIPIATGNASPIAPPAPVSTLPQAQFVDPQSVIDQIVRGMTINTGDGQSTVKLRLVPENLGDVSVKLTVSGGSVTASITAHSVDAQNAIVAGQPQLAKTLADAGLKLQSFNVGLAGNGTAGSGSDQKQQQNGSRSNATRRIGALADESDDTDELNLVAAPSFGPPIYTASGGLSLNYLV